MAVQGSLRVRLDPTGGTVDTIVVLAIGHHDEGDHDFGHVDDLFILPRDEAARLRDALGRVIERIDAYEEARHGPA